MLSDLLPPITYKSRIFAWSILILGILAFHDVLFDCLLSFLHWLFEIIEQGLDILVEHLFHTVPHTTEVIVFYLMLFSFGAAGYWLIPTLYNELLRRMRVLLYFMKLKKNWLLVLWSNLSTLEKIKYGSFCLLAFVWLLPWLFS